MNIYKEKTLNGNWFEERATPLNGVMADYGERCYGTTQKDAFSRGLPSEDLSLTRAAILQSRSAHESPLEGRRAQGRPLGLMAYFLEVAQEYAESLTTALWRRTRRRGPPRGSA